MQEFFTLQQDFSYKRGWAEVADGVREWGLVVGNSSVLSSDTCDLCGMVLEHHPENAGRYLRDYMDWTIITGDFIWNDFELPGEEGFFLSRRATTILKSADISGWEDEMPPDGAGSIRGQNAVTPVALRAPSVTAFCQEP